jgi:hypothetical protein
MCCRHWRATCKTARLLPLKTIASGDDGYPSLPHSRVPGLSGSVRGPDRPVLRTGTGAGGAGVSPPRFLGNVVLLVGDCTPSPTNNLWIAASAMQYGLTILTTDAHSSMSFKCWFTTSRFCKSTAPRTAALGRLSPRVLRIYRRLPPFISHDGSGSLSS